MGFFPCIKSLMIPDHIQKQHLLEAIWEIDAEGVPPRQQSRRYDLFHNGKQYPPKLVIGIANRIANGTKKTVTASIRQINEFLTQRGFTIAFKPTAMSPEEEPRIESSEWVLQQLLAYRETHPDFYFLTRTNKKRDLLEAGHWFSGTDYLQVALTQGINSDQFTRSVGLKIDFSSPGHPQASFMVVFERERRQKVLAFYRALLERLAPFGMRAEKPDGFVLPYGEDILEAMNLFLERDVPIFQALLEEHDLQEILGIPRKRFTHKPANPVFVQETAPEYKQSRLARLCWNTNGWVMPSERSGKSDDETAFESRSGFSLEEWLLDLDKLLSDGYHYGFLQPVNREWPAHTGKKYDIRLYTCHYAEQQHYWVGELTSVEIIDKPKATAVEQVYRKHGWLRAMGEQLTRLGLDPAPLFQRPKELGALFNIRFLPEDVHVYPQFIPFAEQEVADLGAPDAGFLKTPGSMAASASQSDGFKFRAAAPPEALPATIVRQFEHRTVEHPYLHGKIHQGLYNWLVEQHGAAQVAYEQPTGVGGTRIDLAVQLDSNNHTFYEIKTFNSLMICIRTAMGQLLEYAFATADCPVKRLIIVSYHRREAAAMRYLERIRERTGLPVYYGYFDLETGQLEV